MLPNNSNTNVSKIIKQANILNEFRSSISIFVENVGNALDIELENSNQDIHYEVWDRTAELYELERCEIVEMYSEDGLNVIFNCEYLSDEPIYVEAKIKQKWENLTYSEIAKDIITDSKKKFGEDLKEELRANEMARVFLLKQYEEFLNE